MIPGSVHPLLAGKSEYQIPYSLRFRRSNSAYLSRTMGTPTNNKICTWSFWAKRGTLGTTAGEALFYSPTAAGGTVTILFDVTSPNALRMYGAGGAFNVTSASVYRDTSAWYHFVIVWNSPEATSSNRFKAWVNGESVSFSGTFPPQNQECSWNNSGTSYFGSASGTFADSRDYIDGYRAECYFIDGQALTPSSFGQTDSATGVWVPKKYSGTYGTNGFYLKFADASAATAAAIGKDSSGNGNNWTPSGISVTSGTTFDQMTDTPTLNYATGNAVFIPSTNFLVDFRAANLEWGQAASNKNCSGVASIEMRTGKWYWETTVGTIGGNITFGVSRSDLNSTFRGTGTVYYRQDGQKIVDGVNSAYGASYVANDVLGFAYDADAGTLTCYKNNASQGTITITSGSSYGWFPACALDNAGVGVTAFHTFNFGQRAFSYTPPTGFKALNTANLPTPSIKKGSLYMGATLRTGTGATASVSSLGFQPDLVWIKSRLSQTNHNLFDSVRTATNGLILNATTAEFTDSNTLTAFNSNGYSLGSDASSRGVNVNTASYVDWAWKETASAGFDIVSYTGDNTSNRNISHSLGVAPKFAIVKSEGTSNVWMWHANLTGNTSYIILNAALAQTTTNTPWGTGNWSSTQFMITNNATENANAASTNYIAYLWSEIEGFSKFGYYDGNASTDGPFVWCGFRPKFVFMRYATGTTSGAFLRDSVRDPVNTAVKSLAVGYAVASAETDFAANELDLLSNGFKLRSASGGAGTGYTNYASTSYVFAAFAENPFKYARAR